MPQFKYVGTDAQEAEIESVHDFDADPHDSRWEPVKPAKGKEKAE